MTSLNVRRAVDLLPSLATTGIGSLPHTQQELALQMALQMEIPYLPQLPVGHAGEFMIASALDGFPGLTFDEEGMCTVDLAVWHSEQAASQTALENALQKSELTAYEPSARACRSWRPFLWEIEHRKLALAKIQMAGPCTVRWVTKTSEGKAASDIPQLDQHVFRWLWAKTLAMVKALRRVGATPLVYFDEPGLYALNMTDARHVLAMQELKMLVIGLQKEGALVGVHSCSNIAWNRIMELGVDVLSLDVRLSLDALLESSRAFSQFVAEGGTLSLGIIPTDFKSEYNVRDLVDAVETSLRSALRAPSEVKRVLSRALLTPACGLAMRSVKEAEGVIDDLRHAQKLLRALSAA